jgi:hypothetical protein
MKNKHINTRPLLRACLPVWALVLAALPIRAETRSDDVLLLSYFRDQRKGVYLAMSTDGVKFTPLNTDKPIFKPPQWAGQNILRDPSIIYHNGLFRMVWTTQWAGRIFGYAESPDLVHWSEPRQVRPFPESLPPEDQPDNIWAPEIHWDPFKKDFFILFAATTPRERNDDDESGNNGRRGDKYDNRIYITRTKDGREFSDAKLFYDPPFSCIDACMKFDEASQRWVMVIKKSRHFSMKTNPGRNLWITYTAPDLDHPQLGPLEGPIAGDGAPMFSTTDPAKAMAEGQSLLFYRDRWLLLWDEPMGNGLQLASSKDLKSWTHLKDAVLPGLKHSEPPSHAYHGTIFLAPRSAVGWLKSVASSRPAPNQPSQPTELHSP